MSRDPLVDMRDWEDSREAYLMGYLAATPSPHYRAAPTLKVLSAHTCWCGERNGHDWQGKADGLPHPRRSS